MYDYDQDHVDRKYELLSLKVIHRRRRTGFEESKDFPIRVNDLVAGRYQVSTCSELKCLVQGFLVVLDLSKQATASLLVLSLTELLPCCWIVAPMQAVTDPL